MNLITKGLIIRRMVYMKKRLGAIILLLFICTVMNNYKIEPYYYDDAVEYKSNPATDSKQIIENAVEVFNYIGE
jgi:hypothetical protein